MQRRDFLKLFGVATVAPMVFIPKLIEVPRWKPLRDSVSRHDLTFPEFMDNLFPDLKEPGFHSLDYRGVKIVQDLDFPRRAFTPHIFPVAMDMAKGKDKTLVIKAGVDNGKIYLGQSYERVYVEEALNAKEMKNLITHLEGVRTGRYLREA